MGFGRKIREYRRKKAVTQEQLANYLNVSPQTVSKWENEVTCPDINLIPDIAAYFGICIDDLFGLSVEKQFERLENLLSRGTELSDLDYISSKNFLTEQMQDKKTRQKSILLLAQLNLNQSDKYRKEATRLSKTILDETPFDYEAHATLCSATNGVISDWNQDNHKERIDFYLSFVKKNPEYKNGYYFLIDELLHDGRLEEATLWVNKLEQRYEVDFHVVLFRGKILAKQGKIVEAKEMWEKLIHNSQSWAVWAAVADAFAYIGDYNTAIEYEIEANNIAKSPRYTDMLDSAASMCEIIGNTEKADWCYKEILHILNKEWDIVEGTIVDGYRHRIHHKK